MDRFGRKFTIQLGAIICVIGATLQASAQNLPMILVGRILAGWAVGLMSMSVPVYQAEFAHPRSRGLIVGLSQQMIGIGFIVSTYVLDSTMLLFNAHPGKMDRIRISSCSRYEPVPVALPISFPSRPCFDSGHWHDIPSRVASVPHRERKILGSDASAPKDALGWNKRRLDRSRVQRNLQDHRG